MGGGGRGLGEGPVLAEQRGQGSRADAGGGAAEEMAARHQQRAFAERVHIAYPLVMVSSRFRMTLATVVHAASSAAGSRCSRGDSPTASRRRAAFVSLRKRSSWQWNT